LAVFFFFWFLPGVGGGVRRGGAPVAAPRITLNTALLCVITRAIQSCPGVNAHIHYNKWLASGHVKIFDTIDINMPVILPSGKMFTVKLPDFGNKTLGEMQRYINQLMEKISRTGMDAPILMTGLQDTFRLLRKGDLVRPLGRLLGLIIGRDRLGKKADDVKKRYNTLPVHKRINPADINMGTITISNMGAAVKNTRGFPALINIISPQVCAIAIGPVQDNTISFCVVFDHRALDFGDIVPLIHKMDALCAAPESYINNAYANV
jgi:pyruvate dehydrogenase E2 component (dihydrolipoamide acetyltransferase)